MAIKVHFVAMAALLAACGQASGSATADDQGEETASDSRKAADDEPAGGPVGDTELGLNNANATLIEVGSSRASYTGECTIGDEDVAGIRAGPTLGDFADAFPAGSRLVFVPEAMVDAGMLCLVEGGEDQFCAVFGATDRYDRAIEADQIYVFGDSCRTAEGIGPGSTVAAAAEAYGAPTFAYSWANEGREYVTFARGLESRLFRARPADGGSGDHAGNYEGVEPTGGGENFETRESLPGAVIWMVAVSRPWEG